MSHEYNTCIVYKVTLQMTKYSRLKQRLTLGTVYDYDVKGMILNYYDMM